MFDLDFPQALFLLNAFLFQLILIIHFAVRKSRFDLTLRYGWMVYAFSLPSAILSILLQRTGMDWSFWVAGFIFFVWAIYGYVVEYIFRIEWRNSLRWPILVPYVILYLATVMFYWWPVAFIYKPLWYVCAVLFLASTYLNVSSHKSQTSSTFADARKA